jgi:hypothetical protein
MDHEVAPVMVECEAMAAPVAHGVVPRAKAQSAFSVGATAGYGIAGFSRHGLTFHGTIAGPFGGLRLPTG